jgi:hypothetical protein
MVVEVNTRASRDRGICEAVAMDKFSSSFVEPFVERRDIEIVSGSISRVKRVREGNYPWIPVVYGPVWPKLQHVGQVSDECWIRAGRGSYTLCIKLKARKRKY